MPTHARPGVANRINHSVVGTFAGMFDTFLHQLLSWEADLLVYTMLILDPYTVYESLEQGFKAGSNGSVQYHSQGSFGWVLSTDIGEQVATGIGPPRGPATPHVLLL
jgi:hypothetical protein